MFNGYNKGAEFVYGVDMGQEPDKRAINEFVAKGDGVLKLNGEVIGNTSDMTINIARTPTPGPTFYQKILELCKNPFTFNEKFQAYLPERSEHLDPLRDSHNSDEWYREYRNGFIEEGYTSTYAQYDQEEEITKDKFDSFIYSLQNSIEQQIEYRIAEKIKELMENVADTIDGEFIIEPVEDSPNIYWSPMCEPSSKIYYTDAQGRLITYNTREARYAMFIVGGNKNLNCHDFILLAREAMELEYRLQQEKAFVISQEENVVVGERDITIEDV